MSESVKKSRDFKAGKSEKTENSARFEDAEISRDISEKTGNSETSREKSDEISAKISAKSEQKSEKISAPRDIKMNLLISAISASLRLFIPVFGLFFAGLAIDALRGETAFFAIIGAVLGFLVAIFLIWRQIKNLDKNSSQNKSGKLSIEEIQILSQTSREKSGENFDFAEKDSEKDSEKKSEKDSEKNLEKSEKSENREKNLDEKSEESEEKSKKNSAEKSEEKS